MQEQGGIHCMHINIEWKCEEISLQQGYFGTAIQVE